MSTSTPCPLRSIAIGCGARRAAATSSIRVPKPVKPLHHRLILGDLGVGVDDERQRVLHLAESRGDLHQPAQLDHLVEIARGGNDEGKDDRQLAIPGGEPGQLFAPLDDPPPIPDDPREARLEGVEFARLTAIECDVLGILAQPDQAETEIRLVTLLIKAEPDQRVADPAGQQRAADGID